MKVYVLILLFSVLSCAVIAQNDAYGEHTVLYSHQFSAGGHLSTNGWGIQGQLGKYDGFYNQKLKILEISKLKHPKEYKLPNNGGDNSRRFAYGKLNSFQTIRALIGKQKIVSDKLRHGAVAIGFKTAFGASLGLLKPVYVEINRLGGFGTNSIERYDPEIHDFSVIEGRANFFKGLNKIKPEPGLVARASVLFEYSGEKDGIQQLEVGVTLDAFTRKVPIMVEEANNKQFFTSFFLSYSLGKKYNRR